MISNSINIDFNARLNPSIEPKIPKNSPDGYTTERVVKAFLPLIVMIGPLGKALQAVGGIYSVYQATIDEEKYVVVKAIKITFHATSLGLLWFNPLAVSLIQNSWEVIINTRDFGKCILNKDFKKASIHAIKTTEKCVFIASIAVGGPNIVLISMVTQIVLEGYKLSQFQSKDMYLEATVQTVMLGTRCYGIYKHIDSNKQHFGELYSKIQHTVKFIFNECLYSIEINSTNPLLQNIQLTSTKTSQDILKNRLKEFLTTYFQSVEFAKGWSKLLFAIDKGYDDIALILIEKEPQALANIAGNEHGKLLFSVIKNGKIDLLTSLINNGVDPNTKIIDYMPIRGISNGQSPLVYALSVLDSSIIPKILIEKGADVDAINNYGATPLHLAVDKGFIDIIKILINRGVDINRNNLSKHSPLNNAISLICKNDSNKLFFEISELLIANGADVNNKSGVAPILNAISRTAGYDNIEPEKPLNFLINKGAKIPENSLFYAVQIHPNSPKITEVLINHGVKVNYEFTENGQKNNILIPTIINGNIKSLQLLINSGANTECISQFPSNWQHSLPHNHKTPLQLAIYLEKLEMIKILVKGNANLNNKGVQKLSSFEMGSISSKEEIKNFILDCYIESLNP